MAWSQTGPYLAYESTNDLSAATGSNGQKRAVIFDAANPGNIVIAGANARSIGILVDDPTAGAKGTVQHRDVAKAVAGAAITVGQFLKTDANGALIPAVTAGTDLVVGQAESSASAAGSIFAVRVLPGFAL